MTLLSTVTILGIIHVQKISIVQEFVKDYVIVNTVIQRHRHVLCHLTVFFFSECIKII